MKTVIVTIEMVIEETRIANAELAQNLEVWLSDGGIIHSVSSVICRDKHEPVRGFEADNRAG